MDVEVLDVDVDDLGRMTAATLAAALARSDTDGLFAVVATSGTTNSGAIDDLPGIADVCAERGVWLHVDGAYGASALACPQGRALLAGIERADSFGIDPHKWLFAPYDCAALVYRDPTAAGEVYAQHGAYLDAVDRGEWNPADYAYQLTRRARGLPLWFSLVTYGTEAYAEAVQHTMDVAHAFAAEVDQRDGFTLVREPSLSIVLFTRDGLDAGRLPGVEPAAGPRRHLPDGADHLARRAVHAHLPGAPAHRADQARRPPRRPGFVRPVHPLSSRPPAGR